MYPPAGGAVADSRSAPGLHPTAVGLRSTGGKRARGLAKFSFESECQARIAGGGSGFIHSEIRGLGHVLDCDVDVGASQWRLVRVVRHIEL